MIRKLIDRLVEAIRSELRPADNTPAPARSLFERAMEADSWLWLDGLALTADGEDKAIKFDPARKLLSVHPVTTSGELRTMCLDLVQLTDREDRQLLGHLKRRTGSDG